MTLVCALTSVAQLGGVSSYKLKGLGFDSWSGHMPGLRACPHSGHMQEAANRCFSLTWMFLSSLSLLSPLSNISSGEDKKHYVGFRIIKS